MRKFLLFSLVLVVFFSSLYFTQLGDKETVITGKDISNNAQEMSEPVTNLNITPIFNEENEDGKYSYSFLVASSFFDDGGERLSHSEFKGELTFFPDFTDSSKWYSLAQSISLNNEGNPEPVSEALPFITYYRDNVFSDTDLLGLPSDNPLSAFSFLLSQLSYQSNAELQLLSVSGERWYRFSEAKDSVVRRYLMDHEPQSELVEMGLLGEQDDWQLNVDSKGYPLSVSALNSRQFGNEQGRFTLEQAVTFKRINKAIAFDLAMFADGANQGLLMAEKAAPSRKIDASFTFDEALKTLKGQYDEALAVEVGFYLLDNFTVEEMIALLEDKPHFASLLVYALQKTQAPEAEVAMVEMIGAEGIDQQNEHRLLISLGRFGNSSQFGLDSLKALAADKESHLQNTALLSVGSVGKYTEHMSASVNDILRENLESGENVGMTLLAVKNSASDELLAKAEQYLTSDDEGTQAAAIKLFASKPEYQDTLVNGLVGKPSAKLFDTFARQLNGQDIELAAHNRQRLTQLYSAIDHPVVKKRLEQVLFPDEDDTMLADEF
ncbi:hypothetical protein CS022_08030 [Veronia nyctiphanis]|uniref:HEAT repeat domain-containing protein n=1 Tax=Veronia nyctiphanis TaxID=1278244 RepID=A0A4Q0YWS2_9GAMM|nr:hypothetical protein [Veronia nyctiphanis]RXJ73679.1 hypothetical protein CS022_08030 [Veronia nyctiphanis]